MKKRNLISDNFVGTAKRGKEIIKVSIGVSVLFLFIITGMMPNYAENDESKNEPQKPTMVQSLFGANTLVGIWEVMLEGISLKDEYFLINKDGTVVYQEDNKIKWQGTYSLKGDNVITFDNLKYLDKEGKMRNFNYTEILSADDMGEEEPTGCFIGGIFSIEPLDGYRYFCLGDELHLSIDLGDSVKEANLIRAKVQPPPVSQSTN